MKFSQIFKDLRKANGYTAKDVALNIGLSVNMIYEWEHDRCQPTLETLVELADFFECSIDYLLGREDDFGNVTVTSPATEELTYLEKKLLTAFAKLDASEKDKIIYDAEYFASKHDARGVNLKKPLIG